MKCFRTTLIFLLVVLSNQLLFGQPGRGLNRCSLTRLYNKSTENIYTGKIEEVISVVPEKGRRVNVQLLIRSENKLLPVWIAPISFCQNNQFIIK